MAKSVQELIGLLTDNDRIVGELLQLLEEEQESIARLKGERVEEMAGRIRDLVGQLESAARNIRQLILRLAEELGLPSGATLSLVITKLPLGQKTTLEELRSRLLERGEMINRLLEFNRELLEGGLQAVNNSLQFFRAVMTRSNTYGGQGQLVDGSAGIRLVNREA